MSGRVCTVDGCDRAWVARGWCLKHYKKWRRWGSPTASQPKKTDAERFWSKVIQTEGCWRWTGALYAKTGYGVFHPLEARQTTAHRAAWTLLRGEIPKGMVIDHLCRNRACVNPDHLEVVTNEENLRRGAGYALRNGMRTACRSGHPYVDSNTYIDPTGQIRCRACAREKDRARSRRRVQ